MIVFFPIMQASKLSPSILCPAWSVIATFANPFIHLTCNAKSLMNITSCFRHGIYGETYAIAGDGVCHRKHYLTSRQTTKSSACVGSPIFKARNPLTQLMTVQTTKEQDYRTDSKMDCEKPNEKIQKPNPKRCYLKLKMRLTCSIRRIPALSTATAVPFSVR